MKVSVILTVIATLVFASSANAQDTEGDVDLLVISGTEVPIGQALYTSGGRENATSESVCGGALITDRHVITAAHCIQMMNYVAVGTHYNKGAIDGVTVAVKTKTQHPKYNGENSYDYGILELATPVDTTKYHPVTLAGPSGKEIVDGKLATVMGWGLTAKWGNPSPVLLKLDLPIFNQEKCTTTYVDYTKVDNSIVCAGGEGRKDACYGDSGGPLIVKDSQGSDVLIGTVSGGFACGAPGWPSLFARVPTVTDWIKSLAPEAKFTN